MKVGVCEAQQLKERGEKLGLTLADTLLGYMIRIHILSFWIALWRMPVAGEPGNLRCAGVSKESRGSDSFSLSACGACDRAGEIMSGAEAFGRFMRRDGA